MFGSVLNSSLYPLTIFVKLLAICLLNLMNIFYHISSNAVMCKVKSPRPCVQHIFWIRQQAKFLLFCNSAAMSDVELYTNIARGTKKTSCQFRFNRSGKVNCRKSHCPIATFIRRWHSADIAWICQRPKIIKFHVFCYIHFCCKFDGRKIGVDSMEFLWHNIDGQKIDFRFNVFCLRRYDIIAVRIVLRTFS